MLAIFCRIIYIRISKLDFQKNKGVEMKKSFVLIVVFLGMMFIFGVITVSADSYYPYTEGDCGHRIWMDFPGPSGQQSIWMTSDPGILVTESTSHVLENKSFIISKTRFALSSVPVFNTWSCYYSGSFYPPKGRVDEILEGYSEPFDCVFVESDGSLITFAPTNGTCDIRFFPEPNIVYLPLIVK